MAIGTAVGGGIDFAIGEAGAKKAGKIERAVTLVML
jgi:hypothetical protein